MRFEFQYLSAILICSLCCLRNVCKWPERAKKASRQTSAESSYEVNHHKAKHLRIFFLRQDNEFYCKTKAIPQTRQWLTQGPCKSAVLCAISTLWCLEGLINRQIWHTLSFLIQNRIESIQMNLILQVWPSCYIRCNHCDQMWTAFQGEYCMHLIDRVIRLKNKPFFFKQKMLFLFSKTC